jgi:hypothetical protein
MYLIQVNVIKFDSNLYGKMYLIQVNVIKFDSNLYSKMYLIQVNVIKFVSDLSHEYWGFSSGILDSSTNKTDGYNCRWNIVIVLNTQNYITIKIMLWNWYFFNGFIYIFLFKLTVQFNNWIHTYFFHFRLRLWWRFLSLKLSDFIKNMAKEKMTVFDVTI